MASYCRGNMKASVDLSQKTNKKTACVFVSLITLLHLLQSFLCVFMSACLCNYSYSPTHNSDSCRFCQAGIQELVINNSVRFVWPAERSACF